jgi:predicted alpha/beta hydrolase
MRESQDRVIAADGTELAARFFAPAVAPRGAVLLVPAMGTRQGFYVPLAAWLAEQGFLAATFDFRGTGRSLNGPMREAKGDLLDWARLDCGAMVDALAARAGGAPLTWIGHSLGGQIIPFVPGIERFERLITVAAGIGYWRIYPWHLRIGAPWLWHVLVPLGIALFGYFPGRRLRKIGDVPAGAMSQWRRWCLDPDYAAGAERAHDRYGAVRLPILSLSFSDDELMSGAAVDRLHAFYTGAQRTMRRIEPAEAGVARVGHFGFFREKTGGKLWREVLLPAIAARG